MLEGLFDGFDPEALGPLVTLWPGVEMLPLHGIDASGKAYSPGSPSAAILRYAPGAAVPTHAHPGYEHIIVLSGSQRDAHGTYRRGACVMSPPGSSHAVASEEGCVVLAIWAKSVEVLGA